MEHQCPSCGHQNPPGANFCSSCGSELIVHNEDATGVFHIEDSTGEHEVDRALFSADEAILVVTSGSKVGSRYALDKPVITAGRHPDSDIFLDDVTVSRRHVEVVETGSGHRVRDVGSLNGTYLNRKRIDEGDLVDGDELQIGRFKLAFFHGTKPDGG